MSPKVRKRPEHCSGVNASCAPRSRGLQTENCDHLKTDLSQSTPVVEALISLSSPTIYMADDTLQNLRERRIKLKEQLRNGRILPASVVDDLTAVEVELKDKHWDELDASEKSSLDPVRRRREGNSQE